MPLLSGFRVGDLMVQQSPSVGRSALAPAPAEDGRIAYPTTYYPAATSAAQLTTITLGSGEERNGVDLHLRLVATHRVSGTVKGAEGPVANIGVRLLPANMDDLAMETGFEIAETATDAAGAFTFMRCARRRLHRKGAQDTTAGAADYAVRKLDDHGELRIRWRDVRHIDGPDIAPPSPLPTEPTLWASQGVSVGDSDVAGVNPTLRTGSRLTGRVEFEGTRTPPTPDQIQRMSVTALALDVRTAAVSPGRVTPDLQFRTLGYPPGRYL